MRQTIPLRHLLLAVLIVAIWGSNFTISKIGLAEFPPLFLAFLRFGLVAVPAIFFVSRPKTRWRHLVVYGLSLGLGAFGSLFFALQRGWISPGVASILMQLQVFFTLIITTVTVRETVRGYQWLALVLALLGILTVLLFTDGSITTAGVCLLCFAAMCWAVSNIAARAAGPVDLIGFIVWSCLFAAPPLLLLSCLTEGWASIQNSLAHASARAWLIVLWQVIPNTLFGFGVWAWLIARYQSNTIVPMALLVPVFGMSTAALVLDEALPWWKLLAAGLIISALAVNLFWGRFFINKEIDPH